MLPRSVLAWLTCDADRRLAGIAQDGHPADLGRRSRTIPTDLRRAVRLRDRHCRFPAATPHGTCTPTMWCAASLDQLLSGPQPPPAALQPPWWDGAGYDLNETIAIVGDMLLDIAA